VVGFTDPVGARHGFGALLLGYYDPDGKLRYAGRVGTGFNTARLTELRPRFDAIERRSPAAILPKGVSKKGVHWTEPRLVAEVQYSRWTADAILRHASFQGLREDKSPEEVVYDPAKLGKAPHQPDASAASTPSGALPSWTWRSTTPRSRIGFCRISRTGH